MAKDFKFRAATRKKTFNGLAVGFAVCCLLFVLLMRASSGQPCDKPSRVHAAYSYHDYNKMIVAALRQSQAQVADFNCDGKVNCIDYACSFKDVWDRMYPDRKDDCKLVRNRNSNTGMNHLFARIWNGCETIDVETWAYCPNDYSMKSNWNGGEYDPNFIFYGETEFWMSACKTLRRN